MIGRRSFEYDPSALAVRDVGPFRLVLRGGIEAEHIPPHIVAFDMRVAGADGRPRIASITNAPGYGEPLDSREDCLDWLFRDSRVADSPDLDVHRQEIVQAFDELCEEGKL